LIRPLKKTLEEENPHPFPKEKKGEGLYVEGRPPERGKNSLPRGKGIPSGFRDATPFMKPVIFFRPRSAPSPFQRASFLFDGSNGDLR